tara:strand:+ start:282 stop:503 length:222 start_codon:yes stop_codon:yes gene_type:complete
MNIKQYKKDGSADIEFSESEIEIIRKKGKLHYDPVSFKHVVNSLAKMVFLFHEKFPDNLKNLSTPLNKKIEGK